MTPQKTETKARAVAHSDAFTHAFGIAALLVSGLAVPALFYVAAEGKMSTQERWVIRGAAGLTALFSAPLAALYLGELTRRTK